MVYTFRAKLDTKVGSITFEELLCVTDKEPEIELLTSDEAIEAGVELVSDGTVKELTKKEKAELAAKEKEAADAASAQASDGAAQVNDPELTKLQEEYAAKFGKPVDEGFETNKEWISKKLAA